VQLAKRRIREYKQQLAIPLFVEKADGLPILRDSKVAYASGNSLDE